MWASHDQWATALTPAASKGVDLLPLLRSEMPMPTAVPTQAAAYASMRFEVELYKDYFSRIRLKKKSRKSYLDAEMMGEGTFEEWLEEFDLPEKLMERIKGIRTQVPKALEIIFGDQFAQTSGQQRKRKEEKEAREFLGALGDQKSQMSTAGAD